MWESSSLEGIPASVERRALKVLHLDLRHLNSLEACEAAIASARGVGFSHICVGPVFDLGPGRDPLLVFDHQRGIATWAEVGTSKDLVKVLRQACEKVGLALFVDVVLDRIAVGGASEKA